MPRTILVILLLALPALLSAQLLINEVQSSNLETYRDEDGDFEDWIELINAGADTVNLGGWWLSDDTGDPYRWSFPDLPLPPDSMLLVMASGKDRLLWVPHWETEIDRGAMWRYFEGLEAPPEGWMLPEFSDTTWSEGPSGFGNGDGDDATFINADAITCYVRCWFGVEDLHHVVALLMHVDYDDGYVAYLNGVEVARRNLGYPGEELFFDTTCDLEHEAGLYRGLWPDFQLFPDPVSLLQADENLLALEVHNEEPWNDMSLIPFLTLGLSESPMDPKGLSADLTDFLPFLHTDFAIDSDGESILLTRPNGALEDRVDLPALPIDYSYGRFPDGAEDWLIFPEPTPKRPNDGNGAPEIAAAPEFSAESGYYSDELYVWLTSPSPDAVIYYTHDSTVPTDSSLLYQHAIYLSGNKAVRARAFEEGKLPSPIVSKSYIFDEPSVLPMVSLISDKVNIWDEVEGFYVLGDEYDPEWPFFGANFWEDWEKPFHLDYVLPDGTLGFGMELGLKIHGGYSRAFSQKSLRLIPRGGYGQPTIDYPLFEERELSSFKRLILRNSGNEWPGTVMRDALAQRITDVAGLERQASTPVRVYMNALYWGIYNLRERLDRFYLADHFGVDPDNLDIIEFRDEVQEGNADDYLAMLDYIEANSLADSAHFEYVKSQMDVDNYAAYCIFEIYLGNTDWPGGNIKFWRTREPVSRWRWLLYDLDVCLGFWEDYQFDTLSWATDANGWGEQNQPWATFLLRNLLRNTDWRKRFVNRYADYLNSVLRPEHFGALMDSLTFRIEPEIPLHMERWDRDTQYWHDQLAVVAEFIQERPAWAREHLREKFSLGDDWRLTLAMDPPGAGSIELEGIEVDTLWSGDYFLGTTVRLEARAAPGFRFAGWSDPALEDSLALVWALGDSSLTAHFELDAPSRMVINEINYHGPDSGDPGDWIEIHNPTPVDVHVDGWALKDGDDLHVFTLPEETVINSGSYLIFCEDLALFTEAFPDLSNVFGDLGFGFSGNGEAVRLFDASGNLVDRVDYEDGPPWPPLADGFGPTLELIHPELDNSLPESWASSVAPLGTPGERNSAFDAVGVDSEAPSVFEFEAPWPNPFNPSVALRFALPEAGRVRLDIFDLQGRRLETLLDGHHDSGRHEVRWDAEGRASGVYFARLQAGDQSLSHKLLLLK